MKFWALRNGDSLYPADPESVEEFSKIPWEKVLQVEAKQPRNGKFHRLFWKLCARIGQGIGKDAEWIERAFKTELEYYDVFEYQGREVFVLRSISFADMDNIAFGEFFESAVQVAYRRWEIDPASVSDLLAREESQKR